TYTSVISTLSLHDALPIYNICFVSLQEKHCSLLVRCNGERNSHALYSVRRDSAGTNCALPQNDHRLTRHKLSHGSGERKWQLSRSEEHTSELQSLRHLVCR